MTTEKQAQNEQYQRARREFDDLRVEEKAVFLLEATVSTIARGLERAGRVLADELDRAFRMGQEAADQAASTAEAAASEAAAESAAGRASATPPKSPAPGLDPEMGPDDGRTHPGEQNRDVES